MNNKKRHMIEKDKKANTESAIKHKDLKNALRGCANQINKLLKTSQKHNENKNYPQCIVDCIFAFEEITKFEIYAKHQREFKDISKSKMKKLEEHAYKLTVWLDEERLRDIFVLENTANMSKNDKINKENKINESAEKQKKLFVKFDKIKQLGMYTDFVKGKTISLDEHFMKTGITKNNLEIFCYYLFRYTNYRWFLETLRTQCGNIMGIIDPNGECVHKNNNYKYIIEYQDFIKSDNGSLAYKKFLMTISELKNLVDYLKEIK